MIKKNIIVMIMFMAASFLIAAHDLSQETVNAIESYESLVAANRSFEEIEAAALDAINLLTNDLADAQNQAMKESIYGEIALLYDAWKW